MRFIARKVSFACALLTVILSRRLSSLTPYSRTMNPRQCLQEIFSRRGDGGDDFTESTPGYRSFVRMLISQRVCRGSVAESALTPFQMIFTPMHTSRNEVSFMITVIPVGPTILLRRSANP
jgi:hypothetical protein